MNECLSYRGNWGRDQSTGVVDLGFGERCGAYGSLRKSNKIGYDQSNRGPGHRHYIYALLNMVYLNILGFLENRAAWSRDMRHGR